MRYLSRRGGLLGVLMLFVATAQAQNYYRMRADFSIKERITDSTSTLTMGTVYYDKYEKSLTYRISFPQPETWRQADSTLYRFVNDTLVGQQRVPSMAEFTVFHLALNQSLSHFGLGDSPFTVGEVTREDGQVFTTWLPPKQAAEAFGKVVVAQKNKRLAGVAIFNADGELLSRQVVRGYLQNQHFSFPSELVQITERQDGRTHYRITTFRNLVVNEKDADHLYRAAGLATDAGANP